MDPQCLALSGPISVSMAAVVPMVSWGVPQIGCCCWSRSTFPRRKLQIGDVIQRNRINFDSFQEGKIFLGSQGSKIWERNRCVGGKGGEGWLKDNGVRASTEVGETIVTKAAAMAPLSELYEFICRGPLLRKTGANQETVAKNIDEWLALGIKLSRHLRFEEFALSDAEKVRIYHYYVPVFWWCKQELESHSSSFKEGDRVPALILGISAPQGCGKTTMVDSLEYLFNSIGSRAAAISIDDFYLTADEQAKLAAVNSGNDLLEALQSKESCLWHWCKIKEAKELWWDKRLSVYISRYQGKASRYNKSANMGRGDRAEPSTWPEVEGPVKVVLFEGWMLGFEPLENAVVGSIDPQLVAVNKNLAEYYDAWHRLIDSWIIVQVGDPNWVFQWRLEAEVAMRAQGKPGMTDEQVADFVSRYIPAYKAYLPPLYSKGPRGAIPEHTLRLDINQARNPIG